MVKESAGIIYRLIHNFSSYSPLLVKEKELELYVMNASISPSKPLLL